LRSARAQATLGQLAAVARKAITSTQGVLLTSTGAIFAAHQLLAKLLTLASGVAATALNLGGGHTLLKLGQRQIVCGRSSSTSSSSSSKDHLFF